MRNLDTILTRHHVNAKHWPAIHALVEHGTRPDTIVRRLLNGAYKAALDEILDTLSESLPHKFPEPKEPRARRLEMQQASDQSRGVIPDETVLGKLTPAEKEIVRLVDFQGHNLESAAKVLAMPTRTAEWRYCRAHRHLMAVA